VQSERNIRGALARQSISLQAGLNGDVVHKVTAAATLNGDASRLASHRRCSNHNAWDFHQLRHMVRLDQPTHKYKHLFTNNVSLASW